MTFEGVDGEQQNIGADFPFEARGVCRGPTMSSRFGLRLCGYSGTGRLASGILPGPPNAVVFLVCIALWRGCLA